MSTSEIDALIARHKEALKNIEDSKSFFKKKPQPSGPKPPFVDRVRTHFRVHGNAWSTIFYTGCILVLSVRLAGLRRETASTKEELEMKQQELQKENTKLRSYVDQVDSSWDAILSEIRNSGWTSSSVIGKVEKIIEETQAMRFDKKPEKADPIEKTHNFRI